VPSFSFVSLVVAEYDDCAVVSSAGGDFVAGTFWGFEASCEVAL